MSRKLLALTVEKALEPPDQEQKKSEQNTFY